MPFPFINPTASNSSPNMTLVARATRSTPSVLDTKGKERETRTLHSITFSWSSCWQTRMILFQHQIFWNALILAKKNKIMKITLAMSCRLKGPVTWSSRPIAWTIILMRSMVFWLMSWGGVTSVASPECTPAFSTCSDTAMAMTTPSQATASTSISWHQKNVAIFDSANPATTIAFNI